MSVTPEGYVSTSQEQLRVVLSECANVRTFLGAADATEALTRIYHDALPPPDHAGEHTLEELQRLRPYVLIWTDEQDGFSATRESEGSIGYLTFRGCFMVCLERDVPSDVQDDPAAVDMQFRNYVGKILQDLAARSGVNGGVDIRKLHIRGPARTEPDEVAELGDAQRYWIRIEWGRD